MRFRALTRDGALAAFVVGTLTFGAGGWAFTIILLAFFLPSVALSRLGRARKKKLTDIGKGGARDAWQVLANGGIATVCAVAAATASPAKRRSARADLAALASQHDVTQTDLAEHDRTQLGSAGSGPTEPLSAPSDPPQPGLDQLRPPGPRPEVWNAERAWIAAFAGAYAAATADTWGTEIGTLARGKPRSILTLKPIPTGLSGGVTLAGSVAELAGALWTGACAVAASHPMPDKPASPASAATPQASGSRGPFGAIVFGGIAGALIDSVLGATLQELRHCPACGRTCETNPHACGTRTVQIRGIPGFSNDIVNFAATLSGALTAFGLAGFDSRLSG